MFPRTSFLLPRIELAPFLDLVEMKPYHNICWIDFDSLLEIPSEESGVCVRIDATNCNRAIARVHSGDNPLF